MPEWSGERATLLDPIGAEAGGVRRWAARLESGLPATAVQAPLGSQSEAEVAAERLSRLHARPDEHLEPVLGWASDGSEVWLLTDAADGQSLRATRERAPLSVPEAAAVGEGVLAGLEALYLAGLHHGALSERNVWITREGRVRLRGHGLSPVAAPSPAEFAADLRAAGAVLCAALGISTRPDPAAETGLTERAAPALAATARAIANGALGGNVTLARRSFAETAGPLLAPGRLEASRHQLAERLQPAAPAPPVIPVAAAPPPPTPAPLPPPTPPPAPRPRATLERSRVLEDSEPEGRSPGRVLLVLGGILLLLVLVGGGAFLIFTTLGVAQPAAQATPSPAASAPSPVAAAPPAPSPPSRPSPSPVAAAPPAPSPASRPSPSPASRPSPSPSAASPQPSVSPGGVPTYAPASAGSVKQVSIRVDGPCDPGSSCTIEITVDLTEVLPADTDIAWAFKVYNPCTATTTDAGSNHFLAQKGWNKTIGDSTFHLPSARVLYLVGVTSTPAVAASKPLQIGTGSC